MNIKLTVQNQDNKRKISCVLDGEKDIEHQLEQVGKELRSMMTWLKK